MVTEHPHALPLALAETGLCKQHTRIGILPPNAIAPAVQETSHLLHAAVLVIGYEVLAGTFTIPRGFQRTVGPTFLSNDLLSVSSLDQEQDEGDEQEAHGERVW